MYRGTVEFKERRIFLVRILGSGPKLCVALAQICLRTVAYLFFGAACHGTPVADAVAFESNPLPTLQDPEFAEAEQAFKDAANNGGGWVAYSWKNLPTEPVVRAAATSARRL